MLVQARHLPPSSAGTINMGTLGVWTPGDHGRLAWTCDPALVVSSNTTSAGQLVFARVHLGQAAPVTNVDLYASTPGSTLTAGQCFAALYDSAGALIGVTADQAASWVTGGLKSMALVGGPFVRQPGDYYIAWWHVGTTGPAWARVANQATGLANLGLSAPNNRFGTANTGLTTTAPPTMGAQTAGQITWWAALS